MNKKVVVKMTTATKVTTIFTKQPLIYCKDCRSMNSWKRYQERDMIKASGGIFEYAYRCAVCGAITHRDYEPELKINREVN